MAENVLKLKVDSQEYDNKIKRAAEGIQAFARKCQEAGQSLNTADSDAMEFVQALGKMDTVATTTKQQMREMSNALTTLTMTYRGLTDEEKASPFGQELAKGIQQLTERAGQAQDAMMDVQQSIRNAASDTRMFDQMAQGMSVATAGFQGLTGAGKLLGIEMGNDVEVIAKLQSAMAVTNSLTTIQTALQKQSALMQGLNAAKTSLAVVAQQAYAVATGEATAAQAAFNVVADANPYGLMLAAIGAVVGVVSSLAVVLDDSSDSTEKFNGSLDETKKHVDRLSESFRQLKETMQLRGASEWNIDLAEIDALREKRQELGNAMNKGNLKPEDFEEAKNQYYELGKEIDRLTKKRLEFEKFTTELIKSGGASLKTSKEINSAIDALKRLQSSIPIGSEYYNKIEATMQGLKGRLPKTTTDGGGGGGGGGITDNKKELTIQQEIAELEKQALTASEQDRESIAEKIRLLDAELERRKKIVEDLHKIPEEKELTIQQQIAALEKEALTSDDARREKIAEKIRLLDAELDRRKKIVEELHKIPEEKELTPYEQMKQRVAASIDEQNAAVDTATLTTLMQVAIQNGIDGVDADFSSLFKQIGDGQNISDETWQKLVDTINEKLAEMELDPIKIDFETGNVKNQSKQMAKEWNEAANAIQAVGNAMSQIEDPAAKVVGTVAQAVATMALSYSQAALATAPSGWGWIAFAATGLATMITSINAIKEATKGGFANGGIVPGNSFSGDNLRVSDYGINSGELILSRAQQNNLASQLSEGGAGNLQLEAVVDAEQIYLVQNHRGMRTGRGEIVQSRKMR